MKSVLVVEDSDDHRESLALFLSTHTTALVFQAVDGIQALEKIKAIQKLDLIITDNTMPRMNGLELISKIRETNTKIPIFLYTGDIILNQGTDYKVYGKADTKMLQDILTLLEDQ